MVYSMDWRESGAMAAIDTAYTCTEKGADTPGHFVAPSNASRLTKITIGLASLVQDLYVGTTSAVKLSGAGIGKELYLAGPMLSTGSAAATSGHSLQGPPMVYKTNIPINVKGGEIKATAFIHGEDPVSGHVIVGLEYDGIPGRITGADYREETTGTAANTEVTLATRGDEGAVGDFIPQGTIVEVVAGFINDPDGDATDSFNILPVIQLSGNGLLTQEDLGFIANCGSIGPDTDVSGGDVYANPVRYEVPGIATKLNGRIRARGQNVESISEGHAIVCLCYG